MVAFYIVLTVMLSAVAISGMGILQDYKLKSERIKADAMIRAEEVKARNQLEIEKFFHEKELRKSNRDSAESDDAGTDKSRVREKNR